MRGKRRHGPACDHFIVLAYKFLSSEDTLLQLGRAVSHLSISKDSFGWDLVVLERTIQKAKEGQPDSDDEHLESERPALP